MESRPAVKRGLAVLQEQQRRKAMTEEEREILFGRRQFEAR
jgi:GST-like protein